MAKYTYLPTYQGIRATNKIRLKVLEAASNVLLSLNKGIYLLTQGHLSTRFTPNIDFTDELVVHCDVPVAKNTFADDCK